MCTSLLVDLLMYSRVYVTVDYILKKLASVFRLSRSLSVSVHLCSFYGLLSPLTLSYPNRVIFNWWFKDASPPEWPQTGRRAVRVVVPFWFIVCSTLRRAVWVRTLARSLCCGLARGTCTPVMPHSCRHCRMVSGWVGDVFMRVGVVIFQVEL